MGLLGRLLGKEPPKVPAGGRAFTSDDDGHGFVWQTRIAMNGEDPTPRCRKIGPAFANQKVADQYLNWVQGTAKTFEYPAGRA